MQFKKEPFLIAASVALSLGLGALLYFGKIDWPQLIVGLGLLQVPSLFGASKDGAS